jgi:putative hydrolases of HD superfamily
VVSTLGDHLPFLIEVDRLKRVSRQSQLIGGGRQENSAEHSWHLALFALSLGNDLQIDLFKAVKMLLIHDLVEIDAGDTPLHGTSQSRDEILNAEAKAAERIFGLLPPKLGDEFLNLWSEFETGASPEARLARAVDRLQPLIANVLNKGGTWIESGVTEEIVVERYGAPISAAFPELWPEVFKWVQWHFGRTA